MEITCIPLSNGMPLLLDGCLAILRVRLANAEFYLLVLAVSLFHGCQQLLLMEPLHIGHVFLVANSHCIDFLLQTLNGKFL